MPRAKGGPKTRRRHKKTMKAAKGYVGGRRKTYRQARETVERGLTYAYRDRKQRKRDFRGRSITHPELGRAMLDRIAGKVSDVAQVEQQARMEGRQMSMMLVGK